MKRLLLVVVFTTVWILESFFAVGAFADSCINFDNPTPWTSKTGDITYSPHKTSPSWYYDYGSGNIWVLQPNLTLTFKFKGYQNFSCIYTTGGHSSPQVDFTCFYVNGKLIKKIQSESIVVKTVTIPCDSSFNNGENIVTITTAAPIEIHRVFTTIPSTGPFSIDFTKDPPAKSTSAIYFSYPKGYVSYEPTVKAWELQVPLTITFFPRCAMDFRYLIHGTGYGTKVYVNKQLHSQIFSPDWKTTHTIRYTEFNQGIENTVKFVPYHNKGLGATFAIKYVEGVRHITDSL